MKRIFVAILVAALSGGCAPNNVSELRRESMPYQFTIDENYEVTYRRLLHALEECASVGFLLTQSQIQSNLYPDIGLGELSITYNNMGDKSVFLHVEVRRHEATQSAVIAYPANFGGWGSYGRKVESMARNGVPPCP